MEPVTAVRSCSCQESGSVIWLSVFAEKLTEFCVNDCLVPRLIIIIIIIIITNA